MAHRQGPALCLQLLDAAGGAVSGEASAAAIPAHCPCSRHHHLLQGSRMPAFMREHKQSALTKLSPA